LFLLVFPFLLLSGLAYLRPFQESLRASLVSSFVVPFFLVFLTLCAGFGSIVGRFTLEAFPLISAPLFRASGPLSFR